MTRWRAQLDMVDPTELAAWLSSVDEVEAEAQRWMDKGDFRNVSAAKRYLRRPEVVREMAGSNRASIYDGPVTRRDVAEYLFESEVLPGCINGVTIKRMSVYPSADPVFMVWPRGLPFRECVVDAWSAADLILAGPPEFERPGSVSDEDHHAFMEANGLYNGGDAPATNGLGSGLAGGDWSGFAQDIGLHSPLTPQQISKEVRRTFKAMADYCRQVEKDASGD